MSTVRVNLGIIQWNSNFKGRLSLQLHFIFSQSRGSFSFGVSIIGALWNGGSGQRIQACIAHCLTTGMSYEKCIIMQFHHYMNTQNVYTQTLMVYSLLHTQAIWRNLQLLGYKPVQHVTIQSTVNNCNTMVSMYLNISKHRTGIVKIQYGRLKMVQFQGIYHE